MPTFFLHIRNSIGFTEDTEGQELPDLESAREEALKGIRSLLAEEVKSGSLDLGGCIEIADSQGRILAVVQFGESIELKLDEAAA